MKLYTETVFYPYQGHSMRGTFSRGEMLLVVPVTLDQISLGDVIAFRRNGLCNRRGVVHRAVHRTKRGWVTRGDANQSCDAKPVDETALIGRVYGVKRGAKYYPVIGGYPGYIWSVILCIWWWLASLLASPYARLRDSELIKRFWRPAVTCVTLSTGQGALVKYLHSGKTVAVWQPEQCVYWCRKPYDLVLDAPGPTTNEQRISE